MGLIPEKIMYVCPKKTVNALYRDFKISLLLEEMNHYRELMMTIEKKDALEAFPIDATSESRLKSAIDWAKSKQLDFDISQILEFEITNEFVGLKIVGLEIRAQGGRAYKVVTPHGFLVDFREDELMDCIENVGIEAGGIIDTTFVWAINGSQMRVIRKGSEKYLEYLEETNKRKEANELKASKLAAKNSKK